MKKTWMEEEQEYLLINWGEIPLQQIMKFLGRTEDSVVRKARRLGLDVKKKEDQLKRKWTNEEDEFLENHYKAITSNEIADYLNRTASAIRKRASALGISSMVNHWSREEEDFLKEKWGIINVNSIAKKLERSINAVLLKAYQMSLRVQIAANGTYFTPVDISNILGINIRTLYTWIKNGKIRYRRLRVGKKSKYQITVDAFCEFIEKYKGKWNSQKADIKLIKSYFVSYYISSGNTLVIKGELPRWLSDKIEKDKQGFRESIKPWTTKEEQQLIYMLKLGYSYKEICKKLGRTINSIKTKAYMLNRHINNKERGQLNNISF